MKKHLLFLLLFASLCGMAQQPTKKTDFPYIRNQFNVNMAVMKVNGAMYLNHNDGLRNLCPSLDVEYGLNDWLEVGASFTDRFDSYGIMNLFYSAANAKAHLLPAVISPSFSVVDVYATAQLGAMTCFIDSPDIPNRVYFTWGANLGAAFNFTRHFGLFYEFGYINEEHFKANHRFGLNIRF